MLHLYSTISKNKARTIHLFLHQNVIQPFSKTDESRGPTAIDCLDRFDHDLDGSISKHALCWYIYGYKATQHTCSSTRTSDLFAFSLPVSFSSVCSHITRRLVGHLFRMDSYYLLHCRAIKLLTAELSNFLH